MLRPAGSGARFRIGVALLFVFAGSTLQSAVAWAGPGYQLDSAKPSISLTAELPIGVAVDQSSQVIYVAELTGGLSNVEPGQIEQLSPTGVPTAASPFATGGEDLFIAVAVNPVTHGIYAYQGEGDTPFGHKGESTLSGFSSDGLLGTSFHPERSLPGTLAADSSGRVFFPNGEAGSVQIFSSSGTLEGTIVCGGCPGGGLGEPDAVAFDAGGNLYVVDRAGSGHLFRLAPSSGSYIYSATVQNGGGVSAVAVDTSNGDIFTGNLVGGEYHVIAYDSSGTPFDDFGTGLVSPSQLEGAHGQLAVNSTTHKLYLSDPGGNNLWLFERIGSIPAPTATTTSPEGVGQTKATLRASVNPKGHVLTSCVFEYTDHADFLAGEWANAETAACPALIGAGASVSIGAGLTGLSPGTSYDYRVQIESHGGSADGGTQTLETLPPLPPEATTGSATSVSKSSASLGGSVNAKGGIVSNCHFEYVTEAAFQADGFTGAGSKPCAPTPSGTAAIAVSATAAGLAPDTAYRFRVVATNNSGTTEASSSSFATAAETCAENAALCPPPPEGPTQTVPAPTLPPATTPTPTAPHKRPLRCRRGFKKKRVRGKLRCVRIKAHRGKRRRLR